MSILIHTQPFTQEMEEAIHRVHGSVMTPDTWFEFFLIRRPPIHILRYLFINNRIHPDKSDPYNLLSLFSAFLSQEHIDFLLSPEVNININIQSSSGTTPLLTLLRSIYSEEEEYNDQGDEWYSTVNSTIEFFLEKGADPLLENKDGLSSLGYAQSLTQFPEQCKLNLLTLLGSYS